MKVKSLSCARLLATPWTAAPWLPRPWDSPGKNTGVGCHFLLQCMKMKSESEVAQLCQTLHDPMDCSPLGSSVQGIFQAYCVQLSATPWTAALQALLSMEFSKDYYSVWHRLVQNHTFRKRLYFELKGQKQRSVAKRTFMQFESVSYL